MAKYFTDYSTDAQGAQPADTTLKRSAVSGDYTVQTDAATDVLRYENNSGSTAARGLAYDLAPSSGGMNIIAVVRDNDTSPDSTRLVVFSSDAPDTEYGVILSTATSGLYVYRRLNGSFAELGASTRLTLSTTIYYNIELEVTPGSPNALKAWYWPEGGTKPATPDINTTNSDLTLTSGWTGHIGFDGNTGSGGEVFFKRIGIGTNGDPAPTSAADLAQQVRKGSTFDIETTLGTITTATLNGVNVFDHVTGQAGTTVSFAGAATDEITTSGKYSLVLGDGATTETVTIQVNVYGVAPSNNPVQKDGAVLASLTGVQIRVTNGANINGTELFYSGTATTDASGNLSNIDLSSTAAADADPVLLHMRTSAGDSIIASETVGLI